MPKPPHTRVILPPGRPPKCWDELKAAFLKAEENPKDKEYTVEAQRLKNRYKKEVCITLESRGGNCTHELFTGGWFLQANLTAQGQEITKSAEVNQYPGLLNCQKRYTLVCVMCYNDPSKSLDDSLRTSTLYGTGNFCNHMNVKHKDIVYVKKGTQVMFLSQRLLRNVNVVILIMFAVWDRLQSTKVLVRQFG